MRFKMQKNRMTWYAQNHTTKMLSLIVISRFEIGWCQATTYVCVLYSVTTLLIFHILFFKKRLKKTKTIASACRVQSIFDLFDVFLNQLSIAKTTNSVCWCFDVFYTELYSKKRKKIEHSVFRAFCRHPCMRMALE